MNAEADPKNKESVDLGEKLPFPLPFAITRRSFFIGLSLGLGGLAAAVASVPIIGFIFSPFIKEIPKEWRPVGKVEDFEIGKTAQVSFEDTSPVPWAGVTAETAAWPGAVAGRCRVIHVSLPWWRLLL
jgi:hypothetical protein